MGRIAKSRVKVIFHIAKGSGHDIPYESPGLIAAVVRKLVQQSRAAKGTHLTSTGDLLSRFDCIR